MKKRKRPRRRQSPCSLGALLVALAVATVAVGYAFSLQKPRAAAAQAAAETTVADPPAESSVASRSFTFSNRVGERVDLYWDDGEYGMLQTGIDSGLDIQIETFDGHKFWFTQQGNRIPIGRMEVIPSLSQYILTRAAAEAFRVEGMRKRGIAADDPHPDCDDRYSRCVTDAKRGECVRNPGWMTVNCPRSCDACHLRDPKVRCDRERLNMSTVPAMRPGDLTKFFEGIESRFPELGITVHSRDPWVLTMDNFLTTDEADALIAATVGSQEFIRSTDSGAYDETTGEAKKITSKSRTSLNAWCRDACERDPGVASLTERIVSFTGIPDANYEFFQVLKYAPGQYYRTHHDFDPRTVTLPSGPRILTVFLYLSDVEEGGGTNFPDLDITVMPRKGKALIWPSVLDADPDRVDQRTRHQALPVTKGTKLAANAWIHQYNMKIPITWGCTGSFS